MQTYLTFKALFLTDDADISALAKCIQMFNDNLNFKQVQ